MEAQLLIKKGAAAPKGLKLRGAETVIGRQTGCQIRIPSASISRRHCRVTIQDDLLWVEDLGSANGTLINLRRIKGKTVLRPGDALQAGNARFIAQYQLSSQAVERLFALAPPAPATDEPLPEIDVEIMDDDIGTHGDSPAPPSLPKWIEADEPLEVDGMTLEDEPIVPPPEEKPAKKKVKKPKKEEVAEEEEASEPGETSLASVDISQILQMRRQTMLGKGGGGDLNDLGGKDD